jgi:lipopolysaccharide export system protein LptC
MPVSKEHPVTIEAQLVPGSDRYRVRSAEEHERAFRRAGRHSRAVRFLRRFLPVLAVLVFAVYFISSGLHVTVGGVTASVSGIEIADGNLRMVNPKLKGVDKKNGAYVISADYADQDMKNPKMIKLHAIKAELTTEQNGWSRMQSVRGLFNNESERLLMRDDIHVATSSGITGKLTSASLEMKNQIVRSHQPVAFDLNNGTVRAKALTLHSTDHTLLFRGKVVVHINKMEKKPASATAAATPPPPQVKAPEQPARIAPDQGDPIPVETTPQ